MQGEFRARREALENFWKQGLSGQALLDRHTQLVDSFLNEAYEKSQEMGDDIALVSLGGYGRKELFPYSDIDLMVLHDGVPEERLNRIAEQIFYPLWDAGLEVGHAVRTVATSMIDAGEDYFFQVALLDARLVAGSTVLFEKLRKAFQKNYVQGRRLEFLQEMMGHRETRHRRFGKHNYMLEPQIKESQGGLRDIQSMLWSAQVVFGLRDLDDMQEAGVLSSDEKENFEAAWNELIKIRNRLHYISGRKNDQLFFEHQEEMAEAFGHRSAEGLLGVEQFMRQVHGHMQTIAVTTELFFEHATEVLDGVSHDDSELELEPGIKARGGRLHFSDSTRLEERPHLLLRIFVQMARTGLGLHHRVRKIISSRLHLVDESFCRSRRLGKAFMEILDQSVDSLPVLTTMLETGLLPAYIPELAGVVSLAQHDVYHVYTVDRHLLQTLAEVHQLRLTEPEKFSELTRPHLLFLAALLHDVGKGVGKNHAENGAKLANDIGKRLGLAAEEIEDLAFLVRHHLFLPNIALRRDLEDENLMLRCVEGIHDSDKLNMLYLLAIADARATGPAAWNEWKAALLLDLYLKLSNLLNRTDLIGPDRFQGVDWMREQLNKHLGKKKTVNMENFPEEYLLNFTPEEVAHHITLCDGLADRRAVLETWQNNGHWSLIVVSRDTTGLLNRICGVLSLHNLSVLNARIHTWADGTAVDLLDVAPWVDMPFEAQDWQALERDINRALAGQLGLDHRLTEKSIFPFAAKKMGQRPPPRVVIDNETSDQFSVIEVYADDRPRLLYDITRTLADFNLHIFRAKIAGKVDQVLDVFYVQNDLGEKIIDIEIKRELRKSILHSASDGGGEYGFLGESNGRAVMV